VVGQLDRVDNGLVNEERPLGAFLAARRSQLSPEELGIPAFGGQRRVPGLRREELAMLAGVSASYYARLEQGQSLNASAEVLDAIAGALQLDEAERLHLHDLARAKRRSAHPRRALPEKLSVSTGRLIESIATVPAVVLGRRSDVLGWNRAGHALHAGHLDPDSPGRPAERPNMARLLFLDAHTRELYADWPTKARAVVGTLRAAAGRSPEDPELASLIGELSVASSEFAGLWADHRVKTGSTAVYEMCHPLVGAMTVTQQSFQGEGDQHLITATTEPGSPSAAAMTLLVHSAISRGPRPEARDGVTPAVPTSP
jgi:transcriptional regulator with XRE-family HTH domain